MKNPKMPKMPKKNPRRRDNVSTLTPYNFINGYSSNPLESLERIKNQETLGWLVL
jgi:hypothetical protein